MNCFVFLKEKVNKMMYVWSDDNDGEKYLGSGWIYVIYRCSQDIQ